MLRITLFLAIFCASTASSGQTPSAALQPEQQVLLGSLNGAAIEAIPSIVKKHKPSQFEGVVRALKSDEIRAWVRLSLAQGHFARAQYNAARTQLNLMPTESTAASEQASRLSQRISKRLPYNRRRLGVLLPLTGRYGAIGNTVLSAIKLAIGPTGTIELVVRDTALSEGKVAALVEGLVQEDHVGTIMGPVGAIESLAAARAAEQFGVPIMTLSSREDLTAEGSFVFRHRQTKSQQAAQVARYAIEELGHKSFAILYPDNGYGRTMMRSFWETVEALGGEIRGCQPYETEGGQYHAPIKKLIGRFHVEDRDVDPFWEALNRKSKDKGHHVAPVVDFDALFIPDGTRRLRVLLPFLSYWDILIDHQPGRSARSLTDRYGGEVPRLVQLLGGAGFNDARLRNRPISLMENSVFVDAFYPGSPAAVEFTTRWKERMGRPAPTLAAHAYDATRLVMLALKDSESRLDVRTALMETSNSQGIFGATGFDVNGEVRMDAPILTLHQTRGIMPHRELDLADRLKQEGRDEDTPN